MSEADPMPRAVLLAKLDEILGPDPLDVLRDELVSRLGVDVALPAMRIVRPAVERMRAEWQSLRREMRDDYLTLLNGDAPTA
jgi:hypothetical protein